jgi:hypothetical protein
MTVPQRESLGKPCLPKDTAPSPPRCGVPGRWRASIHQPGGRMRRPMRLP